MKIGNLEVYGIIYKITNTVNGKVYIGQTTKSKGFNGRYCCKGEGIERVYKYHKKRKDNNSSYNEYLLNSIEKYGFEAFEVIKVFDVAFSQDELNIKEISWISIYDSFKNGYNFQDGGMNGKPSLETKNKISLNHADFSGENSCNAKINNKQAEKIKIELSKGHFPKELSLKYDIPVSIIQRIKNLFTFKNVRSDLNDIISKNTKASIKYKEKINICNMYYRQNVTIANIIKTIGVTEARVRSCIKWGRKNIDEYKKLYDIFISNNPMGVSFRKDKNKWRAYVYVNKKQKSLGNFKTKEEAIEAREKYINQL